MQTHAIHAMFFDAMYLHIAASGDGLSLNISKPQQ